MNANRGTLWVWFQEAIEELDAGHKAVMDGWEIAQEHLEGAHNESWKGWIRQSVRASISRAKSNPVGLWLTVLRDGPTTDLGKPPSKAIAARTAHEMRSEETRKQLAAINALPQGQPPLSYGVRARREGRDPLDVYEAWEAAGRPPMHEFPYPFELQTGGHR